MVETCHFPGTVPASYRDTLCFRRGQWQATPMKDLSRGDLAAQKCSDGRLWRYHDAPIFWVCTDPFEMVNFAAIFARPAYRVPAPGSFESHFEAVALRKVGSPATGTASGLYGAAEDVTEYDILLTRTRYREPLNGSGEHTSEDPAHDAAQPTLF